MPMVRQQLALAEYSRRACCLILLDNGTEVLQPLTVPGRKLAQNTHCPAYVYQNR
jgi:hypothetical protein